MDLQDYLKSYPLRDNVYYLTERAQQDKSESLYNKVRSLEGRDYSGIALSNLPHVSKNDKYFNEWRIRSTSQQRIVKYLTKKALQSQAELTILDLGCGNGWMSHRIAKAVNCFVYALDVNQQELHAGAAVFNKTENLFFIFGNIYNGVFKEKTFDVIILASSIQYFSNVQSLLTIMNTLLKDNGEIHIIDSPWYDSETAAAAEIRTKRYYSQLGIPDMARYYHHQTIDNLSRYDVSFLYDASSLLSRTIKYIPGVVYIPFSWVRISVTPF